MPIRFYDGKPVIIYALSDPTTNQIRYVGISINPEARLRAHYSAKTDSYVCRWIKSIRPYRPEMIHLETIYNNYEEHEQFWIAYMKFIGFKLCNSTVGGEGCTGHTHSPQTKAKLSELLKGREMGAEWRSRMSEAGKNRVPNPDAYAKSAASRRGLKRSDEAIKKTADAQRGRTYSAETIRRMSEAKKGRTLSEETKQKLSAALKGRPKKKGAI